MVMVVTGNSFMLLEAKNMGMKYRVELAHIKHVSMSSYSDQIFVLHIDSVRYKDDLFCRLSYVELVKLYRDGGVSCLFR